jgi:hypothetical protein
MSKAGSATFLALVLAGGALYPAPGSAQVLPSAKVSSALGPLFRKAREQDIKQARQSADFIAELGQTLASALFSGMSAADDTPHSTYVRLSRSIDSSARERKARRSVVAAGLVPTEELVAIASKLEERKEPAKAH